MPYQKCFGYIVRIAQATLVADFVEKHSNLDNRSSSHIFSYCLHLKQKYIYQKNKLPVTCDPDPFSVYGKFSILYSLLEEKNKLLWFLKTFSEHRNLFPSFT